jgi:hypothetical protein
MVFLRANSFLQRSHHNHICQQEKLKDTINKITEEAKLDKLFIDSYDIHLARPS